ncbi:MAG: GNAT family N-acetyltransferase [Armatimonadetes bacterium]|nr:GNAT family N-acetyltransferase [Armatimonadota bacterium]
MFHLRLVHPDDKPLFVEWLGNLSPLTRYNRFLRIKTSFSVAEQKYLTEVDGENHFCIVALYEGRLAGVVRFIRLGHRANAADFALTVADEFQGIGLGTELLNRLCEAAIEREVSFLCGDMLADNTRMFHLVDLLLCITDWAVMEGIATFELDLETYRNQEK